MTEASHQIVARGDKRAAELAAQALDDDPFLEASAYSITEEDETQSIWRLDIYPSTDDELRALLGRLEAWPQLSVAVRPLADADWLAMSLSGLPPVRAGRFFIYGAHDRGRVPAGAVDLRIEAGAAFGTGHHGTTLGCLMALDQVLKADRPRRVLDVGTGTGVLAIAAARCGTTSVLGVDIDPVSVRIARENAWLNRADAQFLRADGLAHPQVRAGAPYDLVFANILAEPLVRLAPSIRGALRGGGLAILSGLLRSQERRVAAAYLARRFHIVRRIRREAWVTLVLRRS